MWRGLSAAEVLSLSEAGSGLHPIERALLVLRAGAPSKSSEWLETLPLAERDRALLNIRRATLGPTMNAVADCPACSATVEFEIDAGALLAEGSADRDAGRPLAAACDGITLQLRRPDSRDLAVAAGRADVSEAAALLLSSCIIAAEMAGRPVPIDELPESARTVAAEAIAADDPLAEVTLELACSSCGFQWPLLFDVAAYFWNEIHHHARRLIGDVARLARAFGWSERDILEMSPVRRQAYIALSD